MIYATGVKDLLRNPRYLTGPQYLTVLRTTSPIIRQADPSIKVLGPSEVRGAGDLADCKGIWDLVVKEGLDLIDQFSFHPYRFCEDRPPISVLRTTVAS